MPSEENELKCECRVLSTELDHIGISSFIIFRPERLEKAAGVLRTGHRHNVVCAMLYAHPLNMDHVTNKKAKICLSLNIASIKRTESREKSATQGVSHCMTVVGEILEINNDYIHLSSAFDLEVQVEIEQECKGIKKGDWVEARGELTCIWDDAYLMPDDIVYDMKRERSNKEKKER